MPLLECVPNVSEGRDRAVVGRLAERVRVTAGARLLDVHRDPAHHRSVFTIVGRPDAVRRAVLALAAEAFRAVDLAGHAGVHPRIGAVDVVPFVPLAGLSMAAAVDAAHATGDELARRFGVPVIYYEDAASAPHRRALEDVRRGGLDALGARLASPEWRPDAGPSRPHPTAGAVAVGARRVLVAFNVQLGTEDVGIARAVARAVRARDGGLPAVKAMGVWLPHRRLSQVSMNLTDVGRTRPADAYAAVVREAARHGVAPVDSELVGLAPAAALTEAEAAAMRLRDWGPDRLLDWHLAVVP